MKSIKTTKNVGKPIDYVSKLCLYGKITEQHAKDINEIIQNEIDKAVHKALSRHQQKGFKQLSNPLDPNYE